MRHAVFRGAIRVVSRPIPDLNKEVGEVGEGGRGRVKLWIEESDVTTQHVGGGRGRGHFQLSRWKQQINAGQCDHMKIVLKCVMCAVI